MAKARCKIGQICKLKYSYGRNFFPSPIRSKENTKPFSDSSIGMPGSSPESFLTKRFLAFFSGVLYRFFSAPFSALFCALFPSRWSICSPLMNAIFKRFWEGKKSSCLPCVPPSAVSSDTSKGQSRITKPLPFLVIWARTPDVGPHIAAANADTYEKKKG